MAQNNMRLVLVKLGGSLITDKRKPLHLRKRVLEMVGNEIKRSLRLGRKIVLANGNGSFGHIPAKKYQTHRGILNKNSHRGIVEVAELVDRLNNAVVKVLVDQGINAVGMSPRSMLLSSRYKLKALFSDSVLVALKNNMVPVLRGDQVFDDEVGSTIFSTERVLGYLGLDLEKRGYVVERLIHCGETDGVYDEKGETIPVISGENFDRYKRVLGGADGTDVTGGMLHKVEESLGLAKYGIGSLIIDGRVPGNIARAIAGKEVVGTRIER